MLQDWPLLFLMELHTKTAIHLLLSQIISFLSLVSKNEDLMIRIVKTSRIFNIMIIFIN